MHILRLITYTHPNVIDIEHSLRVIGCRVVETENHPTQEVHEVVSGNKGQDNLSADNLRLRALSWIVHAKESGDTVDQRALRAWVLCRATERSRTGVNLRSHHLGQITRSACRMGLVCVGYVSLFLRPNMSVVSRSKSVVP